MQLEEIYWTQGGYNPETKMSYNRRKDSRTDDEFSSNMSKAYNNEKYACEKFIKMLKLYSPYKIISYEILVTSEVYKSSNYRDKGDLLVKFDVNGEAITFTFDIKAVPPNNRKGKSLIDHKSVRINMDSHNGMKKKKHIAMLMIGTTYKTERINILTVSDLEDIDNRLNNTHSPRKGYHGYRGKCFYDLDDNDQVFDLPWFSMTEKKPSDNSIENFRKMIRRVIE